MSERAEQPPAEENLPPESTKKRTPNWGKISAYAGIIGAGAAILALYPIVVHSDPPKVEQHRMFDGPIARIATQERGWDKRGFEPDQMDSMASEITYRYAGHYNDDVNGDRNPHNEMCAIKLRANPSIISPSLYPGDSGFVYVQPGTVKKSPGVVLYNPTVNDIYLTRLDYEFVPSECWPGNYQYLHKFDEYR